MAGNILLVLFTLLAVFHVLVINRIVPSNIVWGGRFIESTSDLFLYEVIALLVLILFILITAAKVGYIKIFKSQKAMNICVWIIFAYLLLNIVGNLASPSTLERVIFMPLSMVMAFFVLRLAVEK